MSGRRLGLRFLERPFFTDNDCISCEFSDEAANMFLGTSEPPVSRDGRNSQDLKHRPRTKMLRKQSETLFD